jgi:LysW-gamma-L-lysine carboxypeptidase
LDPVDFLKEMVSVPSLSGQEEELAQCLIRRMSDLGLRAYRDEVGNAVGEIGDPAARRDILLVGHMDTVPGHISVERREGSLYGRGAVDAKGSLAAFVLAAARLAPDLRTARVIVVGTVGEEADSRGARHLAERLTDPPYCALIGEPSGWEGVTLGYKGMATVTYRIIQPGTHSTVEKPGPAEQAVAVWSKIQAYAQRYNQGRSRGFATVDPALREFHTFSDGLEDGAEMEVSIRVPVGFDVSQLRREVRDWTVDGELELHSGDPAYRADKNTPPVRALLRAIRAEGGKPRFKLKMGTSDMNVLGPVWGCPMVAYGPGDSALDHTPHEHLDIDEFLRAADVLAGALEILAG